MSTFNTLPDSSSKNPDDYFVIGTGGVDRRQKRSVIEKGVEDYLKNSNVFIESNNGEFSKVSGDELRISEIRDKTGSTDIPPNIPGLKPQLAAAWVNFKGTGTPSVLKSFNVSTVDDFGVGKIDVNYIEKMGDGDYSALCTGSIDSFSSSYSAKSADLIRVETKNASGNNVDDSNVSVTIFKN